MDDLNVVTILGRLTRDNELKYTTGGTAVHKFGIAVNYSVKKGDKWEEMASFFDVTLFGSEGLAKYLTKGQQVGINGELRQNRWEKDGQKHSKVEIIAQQIQLIGAKKETSEQAPSFDETEIPF